MSLSAAVSRKACAFRALTWGFGCDRRGTIAVFIAAAAIPLIGALGLATDVARGYLVKSRLHQALDAAALAGGKDIQGETRDADIQKFFTANFPSGYMDATLTPLVITPSADNASLTVSASATVPTTFMRVLGFSEVTVAAETQVTKALSPALDLVLSIDLSGSMGSPMTKIEAARQAANDLVDALFGSATTSPTTTIDGVTYNLLNIGLVPWNSAVNINERGKPAFSTTATVTETVPTYTNPITGQTGRTTRYRPNSSPSVPLFTSPTSSWNGCVFARYVDDGNNTKDGDLSLGLGSLGLGSGSAAWVAYEIPGSGGDDDDDDDD
jgi:Flp pilus assembly protein TadG